MDVDADRVFIPVFPYLDGAAMFACVVLCCSLSQVQIQLARYLVGIFSFPVRKSRFHRSNLQSIFMSSRMGHQCEFSGRHLCDDRFSVFSGRHLCDDRFSVFSGTHLCDDRFSVFSGRRPCDNRFSMFLGRHPCDDRFSIFSGRYLCDDRFNMFSGRHSCDERFSAIKGSHLSLKYLTT